MSWRPACRSPAEGLREPARDEGHSSEGQGPADSESLKPGGFPPGPLTSPGAAPRRGIEGRPESQATANGLGWAQVRWHQATSQVLQRQAAQASPTLPARPGAINGTPRPGVV